jgi:hypothetical protein
MASGADSVPCGLAVPPVAACSARRVPAGRASRHAHPRLAPPPGWLAEDDPTAARSPSRFLSSEWSLRSDGARWAREDGERRPRAASKRSSLTMRSLREDAVEGARSCGPGRSGALSDSTLAAKDAMRLSSVRRLGCSALSAASCCSTIPIWRRTRTRSRRPSSAVGAVFRARVAVEVGRGLLAGVPPTEAVD